MTKSIAIVTGSNTGIGLETARGIAETGATVILACRNQIKAEDAAQSIKETTGNTDVHVRLLDLASFKSVRAFSKQFQNEFDHLELLVNNAGLAPRTMFLTEDGFEGQFGVNHLGHFLLTNLLLPTLKASAPSRIVVLSSTIHKFGKIDFDSFRGEKKYKFMRAYGQSKLANILMVNQLERILTDTQVTVNAVHPGPIKTEIYRDIPQPFRGLITATLQSVVQGARTSLHVALSDEGGQVSGKYFANSKLAKASKLSNDSKLAQELWDTSCKLCEIKD